MHSLPLLVCTMEAAMAEMFVVKAQAEMAKIMHDEQGTVGQMMKKVEDATGQSREKIASGMQVVVCLYLVFGDCVGLLCNVRVN